MVGAVQVQHHPASFAEELTLPQKVVPHPGGHRREEGVPAPHLLYEGVGQHAVAGRRAMSERGDGPVEPLRRRLFAAARNTRQAGSLTIIATALVETNSRMDDLIFQEFKGTGNMELVLNRRIAEQYIFPAVDILKSGTRREELIMPEAWLYKMNLIRRALAGHKPVEAMERFLFFLNKYPSNTQMLLDLKQKA